jgi:hypothetical protein
MCEENGMNDVVMYVMYEMLCLRLDEALLRHLRHLTEKYLTA